MDTEKVKIFDYEQYSQIEVKGITDISNDCKPYKGYTIDEFFERLDLPQDYVYTRYFKKRLLFYSQELKVRPESLVDHFKTTRPISVLKCLKLFGHIEHHHIDGMYNTDTYSFVFNLNNYLKKYKIKLNQDNINITIDVFLGKFKESQTGYWVIYVIKNSTRYYLDICEHGNDEYLQTVGIHQYISDNPKLF
jgi:hypothetical protein|tara:strand:- start:75 stop:650 length:576 start_codon:yes stop_codon:yes gene_type:complete